MCEISLWRGFTNLGKLSAHTYIKPNSTVPSYTCMAVQVGKISGNIFTFPRTHLWYCTISFNSSVTRHTPLTNWRNVPLVLRHIELVTNLPAEMSHLWKGHNFSSKQSQVSESTTSSIISLSLDLLYVPGFNNTVRPRLRRFSLCSALTTWRKISACHMSHTNLSNWNFRQVGHRSQGVTNWMKLYSIQTINFSALNIYFSMRTLIAVPQTFILVREHLLGSRKHLF